MSSPIYDFSPKDDEQVRLQVLYSYGILDTPREARFDDLTTTTADLLGVPYAKIGFFDANRIWYKSTFGFNAEEGALAGSIAEIVIENPKDVTYVANLQTDSRVKISTARDQDPNIQSAMCVPITTTDNHVSVSYTHLTLPTYAVCRSRWSPYH